MNTKLFAAAVVGGLLCFGAAGAARCDEKSDIVGDWQKYFADLRTVQLSSTWKYDKHLDHTIEGEIKKIKFSASGIKFRVENSGSNPQNGIVFQTFGYDGKKYQALTGYRTHVELLYSREPRSNHPYGAEPSVVKAFSFAFGLKDEWSLESLQGPAFWQDVRQRILDIKPARWKDMDGKDIALKANEPNTSLHVFVDNQTSFPWKWSRSGDLTWASGNTQKEVAEGEITKTIDWTVDSRTWKFPVTQTSTDYFDGKLAIVYEQETDVDSIKINKPVREEIFTFPKSQARIVGDLDAREERANKAKEDESKAK